MTNKDHQKLGQFHLTEAEKKQLRDLDRAEAICNLILGFLGVLAVTAIIVLIIMEIATR